MAGTGPIAHALEADSIDQVTNPTARTFRAFAEQVTEKVLAYLKLPRKKDTRSLPIGGGHSYPRDATDLKRQIDSLSAWTGVTRERLKVLFERYGTRAEAVATYMNGGTDFFLKSSPVAMEWSCNW